jgi:hypothetical protein
MDEPPASTPEPRQRLVAPFLVVVAAMCICVAVLAALVASEYSRGRDAAHSVEANETRADQLVRRITRAATERDDARRAAISYDKLDSAGGIRAVAALNETVQRVVCTTPPPVDRVAAVRTAIQAVSVFYPDLTGLSGLGDVVDPAAFERGSCPPSATTAETTTPPAVTTTSNPGSPPASTPGPTPGSPCALGSNPDCIDPDGDGQGTYLIGGATCVATFPESIGLCSDLDGDGRAGYPDE